MEISGQSVMTVTTTDNKEYIHKYVKNQTVNRHAFPYKHSESLAHLPSGQPALSEPHHSPQQGWPALLRLPEDCSV